MSNTHPGKNPEPAPDATNIDKEIAQPVDFSGETEAGNRGGRSGINQLQNRAIGQDDPAAEGSRQGRERYRSSPDEPESERKNIPPV